MMADRLTRPSILTPPAVSLVTISVLMRALVQRVVRAEVRVDGEVVGSIGRGLCVLVGVTHTDTVAEAKKLAAKLWHLRIIDDDGGVPNLSIAQTTNELLIVSQFTLLRPHRRRTPSVVDRRGPARAGRALDRFGRRRVTNSGRHHSDRKVPDGNGGRTDQRRPIHGDWQCLTGNV